MSKICLVMEDSSEGFFTGPPTTGARGPINWALLQKIFAMNLYFAVSPNFPTCIGFLGLKWLSHQNCDIASLKPRYHIEGILTRMTTLKDVGSSGVDHQESSKIFTCNLCGFSCRYDFYGAESIKGSCHFS